MKRLRTPHSKKVQELEENLLRESPVEGVYSDKDLEEIPKPVERYFENVLERGQKYINSARVELEGEFRTSPKSGWKKVSAEQFFTTRGFVWDARIEMFPFIPVNVVDAYTSRGGSLEARLLGVLPVAHEESSRELDEGELMRFLAEAVWMPTALLPGNGVEWTSIDRDSAEATISNGDTEVSMVFRFRDGEVRRVVTDRYRSTRNGFEETRWKGHFSSYREVNGVKIPFDSSVEWQLEDGDFEYWRGTIEDVEHRF